MKTLPTLPYLQNIVREYQAQGHKGMGTPHYRDWLSQFGFAVPVKYECLEFPDDFPDQEFVMFILRWS
jgi:hypothetical protein